MFAAVMLPSTFGGSASPMTPSIMPPYRPARPSPLSSSPIRAASPTKTAFAQNMDSSPVLSSPPMHASSPIRAASSAPAVRLFSPADTQSSPVQSSSSASLALASPWLSAATPQPLGKTADNAKTFLRFASRPAKAPPRQSREDTRQTRRSLFLRNVRQRAGDQSWDRRNCEQEIQKLEWWSLEREIRQAKEADSLSMLTEHDFDDAAEWTQHPSRLTSSYVDDDDGYDHMDDDDDADEQMAETLAREEEAELEAMIASMDETTQLAWAAGSQQYPQRPARPPSPHGTNFSDDGEYDVLFAELLSGQTQAPASEDMDMA